jgi:hypothetical protein
MSSRVPEVEPVGVSASAAAKAMAAAALLAAAAANPRSDQQVLPLPVVPRVTAADEILKPLSKRVTSLKPLSSRVTSLKPLSSRVTSTAGAAARASEEEKALAVMGRDIQDLKHPELFGTLKRAVLEGLGWGTDRRTREDSLTSAADRTKDFFKPFLKHTLDGRGRDLAEVWMRELFAPVFVSLIVDILRSDLEAAEALRLLKMAKLGVGEEPSTTDAREDESGGEWPSTLIVGVRAGVVRAERELLGRLDPGVRALVPFGDVLAKSVVNVVLADPALWFDGKIYESEKSVASMRNAAQAKCHDFADTFKKRVATDGSPEYKYYCSVLSAATSDAHFQDNIDQLNDAANSAELRLLLDAIRVDSSLPREITRVFRDYVSENFLDDGGNAKDFGWPAVNVRMRDWHAQPVDVQVVEDTLMMWEYIFQKHKLADATRKAVFDEEFTPGRVFALGERLGVSADWMALLMGNVRTVTSAVGGAVVFYVMWKWLRVATKCPIEVPKAKARTKAAPDTFDDTSEGKTLTVIKRTTQGNPVWVVYKFLDSITGKEFWRRVDPDKSFQRFKDSPGDKLIRQDPIKCRVFASETLGKVGHDEMKALIDNYLQFIKRHSVKLGTTR